MTKSVDVGVLVGQSNAKLALSETLTGEQIGTGVPEQGSLIQLACKEASLDLGLGTDGVISLSADGLIDTTPRSR